MGCCASSTKKVPTKSDRYKDNTPVDPPVMGQYQDLQLPVLNKVAEEQTSPTHPTMFGKVPSAPAGAGDVLDKNQQKPANTSPTLQGQGMLAQRAEGTFATTLHANLNQNNRIEEGLARETNPERIQKEPPIQDSIKIDFNDSEIRKENFIEGSFDSNLLDENDLAKYQIRSPEDRDDSFAADANFLADIRERETYGTMAEFDFKKSASQALIDKNLVYKYQAECLKPLPQTQHEFLKYIELMSLPSQNNQALEENLLDNGYQTDSRVKAKNNLIMNANCKIGKVELPLWDAFKFTSNEYILRQAASYTDPDYQFDKSVLTSEGLRETSIRKLNNYIIFSEETMAEGMVFSDRNLTAISAAVACLIHFDNKLKTKLVKNLIYPQNVRFAKLEHRAGAEPVRHVHGKAAHQWGHAHDQSRRHDHRTPRESCFDYNRQKRTMASDHRKSYHEAVRLQRLLLQLEPKL